jgi:hypothetical protein
MNDYPLWICESCAAIATNIKPKCASYHNDICSVCNLYKSVTQPRDYGYPELKSKYDIEKIIDQLYNVKRFYMENSLPECAAHIQKEIDFWQQRFV